MKRYGQYTKLPSRSKKSLYTKKKKVTLKSTMSSQNSQTSEGKCEGSLQIKITVMGCLIKT